jgi:c-di-GMP-binding flagellar brake protein YcgR
MSKVIKIYEPLKDLKFTEKVFTEVAQEKTKGMVKAKNIAALPCLVLEFKNGKLGLTPEPLIEIPDIHDQSISLWFDHKEYLYIFESKAQIQGQMIFLDLKSGVIFQQQKRAEFRFEIPKRYQAAFEIKELNGKSQEIKGQVVNISLSGALFTFDQNIEIKTGDQLLSQIKFSQHPTADFSAVVRHTKNVHDKKFAGVEFKIQNSQDEKKINDLIFKLRIDVFDRV